MVAGCGAAARVVLKETSDASTDDYDESSETTASRLLTDPYENGGSVTMQHANERSNKSSVSALAFAEPCHSYAQHVHAACTLSRLGNVAPQI